MEIASSTEILLILILFVLSYFTDFLFLGGRSGILVQHIKSIITADEVILCLSFS